MLNYIDRKDLLSIPCSLRTRSESLVFFCQISLRFILLYLLISYKFLFLEVLPHTCRSSSWIQRQITLVCLIQNVFHQLLLLCLTLEILFMYQATIPSYLSLKLFTQNLWTTNPYMPQTSPSSKFVPYGRKFDCWKCCWCSLSTTRKYYISYIIPASLSLQAYYVKGALSTSSWE